jgi:hemoglobin
MVAGLALSASPIVLAGADKAYAQVKQTTPEKSLYERLGGVFAIAAVVDHFSDAVVKNPIVGQKSKNPQLREWHTKNLGRLPGLKFMRTLWVCDVSGGPYKFTATKPGATPLGLEEAHRDLRISPAEFDEVAAELGRSLDFFKVPKREKTEVLVAFAAHKGEVTAGYVEVRKRGCWPNQAYIRGTRASRAGFSV